MGALGHYLEDEGVSTTQISLVREHTAQMQPPRALWVPFQLGRPFGPPGNTAFQKRVIVTALSLLELPSGPALIDFPEDEPVVQTVEEEGWVCPVNLASPPDSGNVSALERAVQDEIAQLIPWFEEAKRRKRRTTFGVSSMTIEEITGYLNDVLENGSGAHSPAGDRSLVDSLKLAVEDLKAFYFEAAMAKPGNSHGNAVTNWFWADTAAGRLMFALQSKCAQSEDKLMKLFGAILVIPASQMHRAPTSEA